ncbi:MAG: bifunctional enoyl-CoA hydratase/phosphate acetyltransferase [Alphaproteobacteria bacterium]|nr:bifunctional enoyl-CoA hydratase/phosphate acetyltransferase [Alphaproteobacteria bacterium]
MNDKFNELLQSLRPNAPRTIALAMATDKYALKSVIQAYEMGFANAILCGPADDIRRVAQENHLNIDAFKIVDCADDIAAAQCAVKLVRDKQADILMKGLVHTADILRAVLNRDTGIRGDGILSHVAYMYSPTLDRRLFLTDIAMVMYPDLDKKVQLINNAVSFAHRMGIDTPKVAPLCAVETYNPAMNATVDADALHHMNTDGKIKNCIVAGPMAFDIAVSRDAAIAKGIAGPIMGDADILLFHNIEAGNNTIKAMVQFGDWIFGGVIMGATAPIIINSRSDSELSKLFSVACACKM